LARLDARLLRVCLEGDFEAKITDSSRARLDWLVGGAAAFGPILEGDQIVDPMELARHWDPCRKMPFDFPAFSPYQQYSNEQLGGPFRVDAVL
jgi:hypothetical protein